MEAELRRRNASGALVPWAVNDDGTEPVADALARSLLAEVRDLLAIPQHLVFVFDQPQMVWVLDHGLGRYPAVVIFDSTGQVVEGDLAYPSVNQAVATFSFPFSGRAALS